MQPENALLPISFTEPGIVIDSMFVWWNALAPIFSRPSFKIISSRFLQPENAPLPISFTEPGIVIDSIFVLENASSPIFSRPSFKITSLRFAQPENASLPISFIELGIVTFVVFLSKYANIFLLFLSMKKLSLISKFLLFGLIEICEIFEKSNVKVSIHSRPSFKINSSRFVQPENAPLPISFIERGIVTFVVFLSKYTNIFLLFLSIKKLSLILKFLLYELIEICEIIEKSNAK